MMNNLIELKYGNNHLSFCLPVDIDLEEICLDSNGIPSASADLIEESIHKPFGVKLSDIAGEKDKVAIIIDDITRPTPTKEILAVLIPVLFHIGVRAENISITIALGTHRPMTNEEVRKKVGEEFAEQITIYQPDYKSDEEFIQVAFDDGGAPVSIYKKVYEADVRIGIGNIVPHNALGWSGGAKILFPGVANEKSIANFHMRAARHEPVFGEVENPIRREVEAWVSKIGLHFLINTVLDRECKLIGCVSGDFIRAHRKGVELATAVYSKKITSKADLVIVNGEPSSFDFWQGTKGLNAAARVVKDGGDVILAIPCREGVGPHPKYIDYISLDDSTDLPEQADAEIYDDIIALSVGLMISKLNRKYTVHVYTDGLSEEELNRANMSKIADLQERIDHILQEKGVRKVLVIHDGAEILPTL